LKQIMATVILLLKKNKQDANGEMPLYLRIIKDRKTKFLSLGIKIHPDIWDEQKHRVKKKHPNSVRLNNFLAQKIAEAESVALELETENKSISTLSIKENVKGKSIPGFLEYFKESNDVLRDTNKLGTYGHNRTVLKKLKKYLKGKDLTFEEVNYHFLKKYEHYLRNKLGNTTNTVHVKSQNQRPTANGQQLKAVLAQTQSKLTYTPGNRNNFLYLFASNANRAGISEADTLAFAQQQFTDLDAQEIRQTIASAYKHHAAEHATAAFHPGQRSGSVHVRSAPHLLRGSFHVSSANEQPTTSNASIPHSSSLIPAQADLSDLLLTTPILPAQIFPNLPSLLLEGCQAFDDPRERDVFLTGALAVLSGCLTGIEGVYDRRTTYPNLFAFIIAPAASGKSALTFAKQLGDAVHKSLLEENNTAMQQYRQELADYKLLMSNYKRGKTLPQEPEKPPFKVLFIPVNSSSVMVIKHLRDNCGDGIMCETEADTPGNVLKQDWGGYSDLLRKAFHFEKISYSRKGSQEFFEIDQPRLSVAISGTPNQILKLIPSVEDGLFSRFLFYCYAVEPTWRDVSPTTGGINLTEHFTRLSEFVLEIHRFTSENPARFQFEKTHWLQLNQRFGQLLQETNAFFGTESLSSIKRLGAILFRIAMTLTACRRFENADASPTVTCDDVDFQTATHLVEAYLQHAMFLFEKLPREAVPAFNNLPNNKRLFIESLPNEFRRKEAIEAGVTFDLSRATVDRMLESLTGSYLECTQHGIYTKMRKMRK
jgi:hypothetical protein